MPEGLVRSDPNNGGFSYRNGNPIPPASPSDNSNPVNWTPSPAHFGNPIPPTDPTFNSNPVTWVPSPAHFGNTIGASAGSGFLLQADGVSFFLLAQTSGEILVS